MLLKGFLALLLAVLALGGCAPKEPASAPDPSSIVSPFDPPPISGHGALEDLPVMRVGSEEIAPSAYSDAVGDDVETPGWEPDSQPFALTTTTRALPPFVFEDEDEAGVTVTVYDGDGKEAFSGALGKLDAFAPTPGGVYEMVVRKEWTAAGEQTFSGTAWYRLAVTYDLPPEAPPSSSSAAETSPGADGGPILTLEGAPVKQGRTAYLYLRGLPEGETPQVTVTSGIGFTPTFYPYGDGMVALLPARYMLEKGTYTLSANLNGKPWTCDFVIKDGEFETEPPFTVPIGPGTDTSAANAEFLQVTTPIKQTGDPEKYWEGTFEPPLKIPLRITSSFGYTRIINGSMDRHGGIDFAAAADTPVYAPNHGRVLYAGELQLTGYTICIEHGFGLKTWYYHMNGVTVETGDWVEKGQQIGLVGSTGIFTTGAHLHYTATINGAFVNPWQFHEADLLADLPE